MFIIGDKSYTNIIRTLRMVALNNPENRGIDL